MHAFIYICFCTSTSLLSLSWSNLPLTNTFKERTTRSAPNILIRFDTRRLFIFDFYSLYLSAHSLLCFYFFIFLKICRDPAWKMSKYGPEITPYLDTFHAVRAPLKSLCCIQNTTIKNMLKVNIPEYLSKFSERGQLLLLSNIYQVTFWLSCLFTVLLLFLV